MKKTIEELLSYSRTAINNALNNAPVREALAVFGYNEEKLRAGLALYNAARAKYTQQIDEYGDKAAASAAMTQARNGLNKVYSAHLKVARVTLKNNAGAFGDLKLSGQRKRVHVAWLEQTHVFYEQALAKEADKTELLKFGITETKLNEGMALVTAAETAYANYVKETGEAQVATQARDEAIDALEEWMSDFVAILRVAFEDDPQKLEILGIVVKS